MTSSERGRDPGEDAHENPIDLLSTLIGFDTTNPPGNERACIEWVADLLAATGIESETFAAAADRPNLVARIPGGEAPALLLYGHVDVVPTTGQDWTHPPFSGAIEDGCVWGRGALDMKGGVAMLLSAFLRAAVEDVDLAGDLILCILSDEEAGGDLGAGYMVEEHPDQFEGVEYALGEFGGFSLPLGGHRFYPIQVAEKQVCWLRVTFRGPAGHGSLPRSGTAMGRMAAAVTALDETRLPVHVTPPVAAMIAAMAEKLPSDAVGDLEALLDPARTDETLAALDEQARLFDALLHNTVNATVVRGGDKENVIPGEVELTLDARLLPGFGPDDVISELRAVIGEEPEIEVVRYDPGPPEADMGLFDTLSGVLSDADPEGVPVPFVLMGATDGRHLADLGIQSYGFLPMDLPESFDFMDLVHAADERIPTHCVEFGTDAVFEAISRYDP